MKKHTIAFAKALGVVGLINVQYAYKDGQVYVIEVNPRASRTVPFVVEGHRNAARLTRREADVGRNARTSWIHAGNRAAVREREGSGVPVQQVPRVRSSAWSGNAFDGEVMGIDEDFGVAFLKSQLAADNALPSSGAILVTVNDSDKPTATVIARRFHELGFKVYATSARPRISMRMTCPRNAFLKCAKAPTLRRSRGERRSAIAHQHAGGQTRAAGRREVASGRHRESHRLYDYA